MKKFVLLYFLYVILFKVIRSSAIINEAEAEEDEDEEEFKDLRFISYDLDSSDSDSDKDESPLASLHKAVQSHSSASANAASKISPTSVMEVDNLTGSLGVQITTEWIKTYLVPTFLSGKMISAELINRIINEAKFCFNIEDTIQEVLVPAGGRVIVVGDIHGQLESTLSIFEDYGYPSRKNVFIFNGDIVDRGPNSLECILLVFALKIANFGQFYVTRGNHESLTVKQSFDECTLQQECIDKLLTDYPGAYQDFHAAFDAMPYAYIVRDSYFVTHGGLVPHMQVDQLKTLFRTEFSFRTHFALYGMLWNDPCEMDEPVYPDYLAPNPRRGPHARKFHPYVTFDFLARHKFDLLIRSHQCVPEGYEMSQLNRCLTIFSAPNYKERGNKGALFFITEDETFIMPMLAPRT